MTKRNRLIILAICALLFLIITPYIILYSLGYKVNLKTFNVVATGGIYVHALPSSVNVTVDNKTTDSTGIFSNAVFVQNLLPIQHHVLVTKDGYYDYQKTLDVKERSVTKLENVQLFKKDIRFELLVDQTNSPFNQLKTQEPYIIKNNNLYSNTQKITPVIKNIIAYTISGNNIVWLGLDGFLYNYDIGDKTSKLLSQVALKINKKNTYEILVFSNNIFLKENSTVTVFNTEKKSFEDFCTTVNTIKISPDGQKILYFDDHQIFISSLVSDNPQLPKLATGNLLQKFTETITDAYWLNNDYIILTAGNNLIITEIDIRNNVNKITLPQALALNDGGFIDMINPKISFNQQEKRLYILTGNNTLVSEKLVP